MDGWMDGGVDGWVDGWRGRDQEVWLEMKKEG